MVKIYTLGPKCRPNHIEYSHVTNKLDPRQNPLNISQKWTSLVSLRLFVLTGKFWRENFLVDFIDKQTRFMYVLQNIYNN